LKIAVAYDRAFHFYYKDNLEFLEACGIELKYFSPLSDNGIPNNIDAVFFGGGYPEVFAQELSQNVSMLKSVRKAVAKNIFIYAECGGLMYLGRSISCVGNKIFAMAGVLPFSTIMRQDKRTLGYVEVRTECDCIFGRAGTVFRGHEFHYSEITDYDKADDGVKIPFKVKDRRENVRHDGILVGNILASYVHAHFASNPEMVGGLLSSIKGGR